MPGALAAAVKFPRPLPILLRMSHGTDAPLRLVVPGQARAETPGGEQLLDAGLDVAYQPIVHLGSGSVLAYEALARPRHPVVRSPLEFFAVLERAGMRLEGERRAFQAALAGTADGFPRAKLFVNASPTTMVDSRFDVAELLELAHRHGLAPSDLVVEVTESEAVHDLTSLSKRSQELRRLGIGLAVDDAGAGHASFRVITRLRPTYIKLDRDLVSNIDTDGARHAFVEAMVRFSRQIGSRLVAEGIETDAELASLAGLGVEAGQGYYLARPERSGFVLPSHDSRRLIAAAAQRLRLGSAAVTAGELARPAIAVGADATVHEAHGLLSDDPSAGCVVVCRRDGHAVAQLGRRELEQVLAAPDGWVRTAASRVVEIATPGVMTVDADTNVVEAGAMIAARPIHETIQDLVVTDVRGRLVGVAPAREIIRVLADTRTRESGGLHPLSGLPGPEWVEEELRSRAEAGQAVAVLFVDLDRFRDINEVGGYVVGDEAIRAMARCLAGSVAGVEGAAVAHVGGDDFLVLCPPRGHEELVGELVRRVETEVIPLLRVELRLRGAVEVADRVSLSMASVDLVGDPAPGHGYLDWARDLLVNPMESAKGFVQHSLVRHTDLAVTTTTWSPRPRERRRLSLGLVDPSLVLEALERVFQGWRDHLASEPQGSVRFPGPAELVDRLVAQFGEPLRRRALEALHSGANGVEVVLEGPEGDILELLDRIVLVTRHAYARQHGAGSPELAVLERLLRQRARSIAREDRVLPLADAETG